MKGGVSGFRVALLVLLVSLPWGCADTTDAVRPMVSVSDSGGVRFVRIPVLEAVTVPDLGAAKLYSTAAIDGAALDLFRVRDALFLDDGTLVVANGGTEELIFIDPVGRAARRFGGEGEGPGEFRRLNTLVPAPDGGFFAWDYRLTRFDAEGNFIETEILDPESPVVSLKPLAVYADGRIAAVLAQQRYFQERGERRDTVPLMLFGPDRTRADTVGTWMGLERAFFDLPQMGTFIVPIGFARTAFHAAGGGRVAISSTDSLDLTVFNASLAPVLRLVAPPDHRPATDREREAWRAHALAQIPLDVPDVRHAWEQATVRETLPGFEGLAVDPGGRLWIGTPTTPGAPQRRWIVFTPDGIPQVQLTLPALWPGYQPGRTELLAVGRDRIAVSSLNSVDEEIIEVWTLPPTP